MPQAVSTACASGSPHAESAAVRMDSIELQAQALGNESQAQALAIVPAAVTPTKAASSKINKTSGETFMKAASSQAQALAIVPAVVTPTKAASSKTDKTSGETFTKAASSETNKTSGDGPGGYSYASNFHPTGDVPANTSTAVVVALPSTIHTSTPDGSTECSSSASAVKRHLESSAVASTFQTKKKAKVPKPSIFELDLESFEGIKSSFKVVKGAFANVPSNPVETFTGICEEYGVRDLTSLMKNLMKEDWPKNHNKTPAIAIFAKKYIDKLSTNQSSAANAMVAAASDQKLPNINDYQRMRCSTIPREGVPIELVEQSSSMNCKPSMKLSFLSGTLDIEERYVLTF